MSDWREATYDDIRDLRQGEEVRTPDGIGVVILASPKAGAVRTPDGIGVVVLASPKAGAICIATPDSTKCWAPRLIEVHEDRSTARVAMTDDELDLISEAFAAREIQYRFETSTINPSKSSQIL